MTGFVTGLLKWQYGGRADSVMETRMDWTTVLTMNRRAPVPGAATSVMRASSNAPTRQENCASLRPGRACSVWIHG